MKRIFQTLLLLSLFLVSAFGYSQKKQLNIDNENITLKTPIGWEVIKNSAKDGFNFKLQNKDNNNYVKITCIKKTTNLETSVTNQAAIKSSTPSFEYMLIEKVKSLKFKQYEAKLLEFTNSPTRDYYRGGFLGLIDNGYTYIVEYYSFDSPEDRLVVNNIINSIIILKPESRPNFFKIEEEFVPEDIKIEDNKKTEQIYPKEAEQNERADVKKQNKKCKLFSCCKKK